MLDIKFIRENKELIIEGARKKHIKFNPDALIAADDKRKELLTILENKRAEQNEVSTRLPQLKDDAAKKELLAQMKTLKEGMQKEEETLKEVMKEWHTLMLTVPNVPDITVPEGGEGDSKEVKAWGEKPQFDFTPKSHIELMEKLDMVDLDRGTKVAGFRGYFLKMTARCFPLRSGISPWNILWRKILSL